MSRVRANQNRTYQYLKKTENAALVAGLGEDGYYHGTYIDRWSMLNEHFALFNSIFDVFVRPIIFVD